MIMLLPQKKACQNGVGRLNATLTEANSQIPAPNGTAPITVTAGHLLFIPYS